MVAKDSVKSMDSETKESVANFSIHNIRTLDRGLKKVETVRKRNNRYSNIAKGGGLILKTGVDIGLSRFGTLGLVAGKVVSFGIDKTVSVYSESLKKEVRRELVDTLGNYRNAHGDYFERLHSMSPEEAFLELHGYQNPIHSEALEKLPEEDRAIANSFKLQALSDFMTKIHLEGVQTDRDQDVQISQNTEDLLALSDRITNHKLESFLRDRDQDDKIQFNTERMQNNANRIVVLSQSLSEIQGYVSEGFTKIQETQTFIFKRVQVTELRLDRTELMVNRNRGHIHNLQTLEFHQMNPKERFNALQSGLLPESILPPGASMESLEAQAEQQEAIEKFGDIVQGIGHTANILNNFSAVLPIPSSVLEMANTMTNMGNIVFKAVTSFMTPGPMGMLGGFSALTGFLRLGRGGDNGMQKAIQGLYKGQQKIMKGISQLGENQQKLFEGQQKLFEGQQKLFEGQKRILEGIGTVLESQQAIHKAINQKVDAYHKDIQENFRVLYRQLGQVKEGIGTLASLNISACEHLSSLLTEKAETLGVGEGDLSYSQYREVLNSHRSFTIRCQEGIYDMMSYNFFYRLEKTSPMSFFLIKNYDYNLIFSESFHLNQTHEFLEKIYEPALSILIEHYSSLGEEDLAIFMDFISEPSFFQSDIEIKLAHLSSTMDRRKIFRRGDFSFDFIPDYIASPILMKIIPFVLNFYPFLDLIDDSRSDILPHYEEILDNQSNDSMVFSFPGFTVLKHFHKILRLNLIQENIVSGDLMLPLYHRILMDTRHSKHEAVKGILKAAGPQSVLVKNFALFVFLYEMKRYSDLEESQERYLRAFEGKDLHLMQELLNDRYDIYFSDADALRRSWDSSNISFQNRTLTFKVSDLLIELPDPSQIQEGRLFHMDSYGMIFELSQQMEEALLDYSFVGNQNEGSSRNQLSNKEKDVLNRALLIRAL